MLFQPLLCVILEQAFGRRTIVELLRGEGLYHTIDKVPLMLQRCVVRF